MLKGLKGDVKMDIPMLNKEDVDDKDNDIRDQIIEFMKSKGYKCSHGEPGDDIRDFFAKDTTLIEVIITEGVDKEVLEQVIQEVIE